MGKHLRLDFSENLAPQSTFSNEAQAALISAAAGSAEHSRKLGFNVL